MQKLISECLHKKFLDIVLIFLNDNKKRTYVTFFFFANFFVSVSIDINSDQWSHTALYFMFIKEKRIEKLLLSTFYYYKIIKFVIKGVPMILSCL